MARRPLTGEPLPLDLVDTCWMEDGHEVDMFDDENALAGWLDEHGLVRGSSAAVAHRPALRQVRAAIRGVLEGAPGAVDGVNAALAHGRLRLVLRDGRPGEDVELDDPAWGPAWTAARAYLDLIATAPPDRIRHCAGTGCVLWFLDTSRNGARRWCSMAGCGNRAKAHAYYHRARRAAPTPWGQVDTAARPARPVT
jgi:predicted RNA-binding Zn ribbon-like protein